MKDRTLTKLSLGRSHLRLAPIGTRLFLMATAGVILAVLIAGTALSLNLGAASGQSVPAVTGVAVTSTPSGENTYTLGETIRVSLTFGEAVDVSGTPRLKIKMDPNYGEKWAEYESGTGTASLTFAHEVVQPNISTQGIAVLANSLDLNGGIIQSTAAEADADLSHTGLSHDPDHKVDWQANRPATGAPNITGTAQVGETLTANTSGISDADGLDNATFSYQWLADDADISGATGNAYTLVVAEEGKAVKVRVSFTDDAGNAETLTSAATATVAPRPLTASFVNVPAGHDGKGLFNFELHFSENFPGRLSYKTLRDEAFQVENGRVRGAARVVKGENRRWTISVRPDSPGDVTVTLPATVDCTAPGAVCTESGRPLSNTTTVTVPGPASQPNLAPVADEQSEEYVSFVEAGWAPRGILVSKLYQGIFSDPDGDELTFTVSIPDGRSGLVDNVYVQEHTGRVFMRLDADDDWGAVTPALPDPLITTVTLTATDPEGLSASVTGEFQTDWASHPALESAEAVGEAVELTFNQAVLAEPAPSAEQFTVKAVGGQGSTQTIAVDGVSVNGKVVTLDLASALPASRVITLDYAHDDSAPLRRAAGGDAAPSFTGQAVERAEQVDPEPDGKGYKGQLGEVFVQLSLQGSPQQAGSQGATRSNGPSGQSSHTTSIVYVIDDSGSMDGDFPEVRAALEAVRNTAMADTKVALVAFGTNTKQLFGLTAHSASVWTDAHINSFGGKLGGTYFEAALAKAKELLAADSAANKKIIFLADGQDDYPQTAMTAIKNAGIVVDTIGFGTNLAGYFTVLDQMATDTGGTYLEVKKPLQGTLNNPAVTKKTMRDILPGMVADNTATLFLVDHSHSVYSWNEHSLHPALTAAADKAGDSSGTGRQVGLAEFLGGNVLYENPPEGYTPDQFSKYRVINAIGSSSLNMADGMLYDTGSTDIEHALSQAYSTITDSGVTATSKRVVLITDGISAAEVHGAGVDGSALKQYKDDSTVTLDVVAWGNHADRVSLKGWADAAGGNFSVAKTGPATPRGFKVRAGDATMTLSWTAPNDPAITRYQYRINETDSTNGLSSHWTDIPGSGANTTLHIFTGLQLDAYKIQIRALRDNEPGGATPLSPGGILVVGPWDSATGFTATAGDGEIDLSWNDASGWSTNVSRYQYALREGDGAWSNWKDIPDSDGSATSYTVTGLANGTAYTVALLPVKDGYEYDGPIMAATATPSS